MDPELFGLLELGSNSLKFYLVERRPGGEHSVETHKFPWMLSFIFYSRGCTLDEVEREILGGFHEVSRISRGLELSSMLVIATGVFRELPFIEPLIHTIRKRTGVRIRLISGKDEAALMARGLRRQPHERPVIFCDLGGATLEWVLLGEGNTESSGSLPLGAIRNQCRYNHLMGTPAEYLYRSSAYCDELLAGWPLESAAKVVVTGGTAKAVATHLSSEVIHLASLRCLAVHVLQEGPPDGLKPARRIVFLAGLVILWRVLVRCEASEFYFGKSSIRESMVLRLLRLLDEKRRDELHTTLLLRGTDLEREQRAED